MNGRAIATVAVRAVKTLYHCERRNRKTLKLGGIRTRVGCAGCSGSVSRDWLGLD